MSRTIGKVTRILAIAAVASTTLVGTAWATRRVAAWPGVVLENQDFCVSTGTTFPYSAIGAGCSGVTKYIVPLPYDTSGSKTVSVTINGTLFTNCRAEAISGDGTGFVASGFKGGTGMGTWTRQTLGAISVPSHGELTLSCQFLEAGGRVSVVEYNQ
jgi:hypothetical protein